MEWSREKQKYYVFFLRETALASKNFSLIEKKTRTLNKLINNRISCLRQEIIMNKSTDIK